MSVSPINSPLANSSQEGEDYGRTWKEWQKVKLGPLKLKCELYKLTLKGRAAVLRRRLFDHFHPPRNVTEEEDEEELLRSEPENDDPENEENEAAENVAVLDDAVENVAEIDDDQVSLGAGGDDYTYPWPPETDPLNLEGGTLSPVRSLGDVRSPRSEGPTPLCLPGGTSSDGGPLHRHPQVVTPHPRPRPAAQGQGRVVGRVVGRRVPTDDQIVRSVDDLALGKLPRHSLVR